MNGGGAKKLGNSSFIGVDFVRGWSFDKNQIFCGFNNNRSIRPYIKCVEMKVIPFSNNLHPVWKWLQI